MDRPRTVVVEDNPPFRASVVNWLRGMGRVEVVGAFDSAQCTPRELAGLRPDLLLLGLEGAKPANLFFVSRVKAAVRPPKLVVMSFFAVRELEAAVLALGADGFVPKDAVVEKLPPLLEKLFDSGAPLSP